MTLRVASFNIRTTRGRDGRNRWWFRRTACVTVLRGLAADVIGLQEVRPPALAYLRHSFRDATFLGDGRDRDGGGERAAIMVLDHDWTVESSETRWLSPTPAVRGSLGWDAGLPRVVTLARLRRAGVRLGIANTHFDSRGRVARELSAELLAAWLAEEPDRPWVIVGDLNAAPSSAPVRHLLAAGFADPMPADAGGTEHGFTGRLDRGRIDYVLTGGGVRAARTWIDHTRPGGRLPSDHWPVVADLELE